MSENKETIRWDAMNVMSWPLDNAHFTQRDLNRYYLLGDYRKARFGESVLLPGWFMSTPRCLTVICHFHAR